MFRKIVPCVCIDWDNWDTLERFWRKSGQGLWSKISLRELHGHMKGYEGYSVEPMDWRDLFLFGDNSSNKRYYPIVDNQVYLYDMHFCVSQSQ
tara:strand:+ start:518 stop:796 length:279 start_codon:yes stop_codon:yes gene_type:complete